MPSIDRSSIIKQRQEGLVLLEQQAFKAAEPYFREVLQQTLDQRNAETFMLMQRLAESLIGQGKFSEAEGFAKKALSGFRKYGPEDEDFLDCQCLIAECLCGQRKCSDAVDFAQSALEGLETNMKRGPEHATTLKCRAFLAMAYKGQYKLQEASQLAKYNLECLEVVNTRAEINASMGSRRLSHPERHAFAKVETICAKILGLAPPNIETVKQPKRTATIESVSTEAPESDSRLSSQQNSRVPSKENSRVPSKELHVAPTPGHL